MSDLQRHRQPDSTEASIVKRRPNALIHRSNWRDTRAYLKYCAEVRQNQPRSITFITTALDHLLRWATRTPFTRAPDIRPVYPQYLLETATSASYQKKLLAYSRAFFTWSKDQWPDRYGKLTAAWIATLVTKKKPGRIKPREVFTLDHIRAILRLPPESRVDRRDIAAVAFLFLSGMRVSAFCTLPLRGIELDHAPVLVHQWPDWGTRTKNGKAADTFLLPQAELTDLHALVRAWHSEAQAAVGPRGMFYTRLEPDGSFSLDQVPGEHRANGLRLRLKELCQRANVPYMSPHKIRRGHIVWASERCNSLADYKAVSQNVMHESISLTDTVYNALPSETIGQRIAQLSGLAETASKEEIINHLVTSLFGDEVTLSRS